jgi:hypothetical protein
MVVGVLAGAVRSDDPDAAHDLRLAVAAERDSA